MKRNKHCFVMAILVLLLSWSGASLAASPRARINFQGVLRDASGAPANGSFDMVFRYFGNDIGVGGVGCNCGEPTGGPGCNDPICEAEVCAIDPLCCTSNWDEGCAVVAEQFVSCQTCIANEEVLIEEQVGTLSVVVTDGLFDTALGKGSLADGTGGGFYGSLGQVFRDYDIVYVEIEVEAETLSPRIRVESSAYTQNALHLEGRRAFEFLDTSVTAQVKAGDLEVQSDVTVGGALTATSGNFTSDVQVGGDLVFADGTVQTTAVNFLPPDTCFDNVGRFVACGDGTVKDNLTGLFWLEDANCPQFGPLTWADASIAAAQLADGQCELADGSSPGDWRLPTDAEWQVIVDQANSNACSTPFFPDTLGTGCCGADPCAFAGVQSGVYWSSTTNASNPFGAWSAFLNLGNVSSVGKTPSVLFVWPVRAGP